VRAGSLAGFFLVIAPYLALAAEPAVPPEPARHRLVTLELEGSSLRVLASQVVSQPLPRQRGGQASAPTLAWRVRLLGPGGAVLHARGLADPTELRVELADAAAGRIRGQRVQRSGPVVFCVRVPEAAGRLELQRLEPARAREARPAEADWQPVAAVELKAVAP
jgi:hypothetical protein